MSEGVGTVCVERLAEDWVLERGGVPRRHGTLEAEGSP